MKLKIKETAIQSCILDGLTRLKILCWRNQQIPVPIRRGRAIIGLRRADPWTVGLPDILAILKGGKLLGIEVKSETGKQSIEQKEWQEKFEKADALYLLARSWDDVERELKKYG